MYEQANCSAWFLPRYTVEVGWPPIEQHGTDSGHSLVGCAVICGADAVMDIEDAVVRQYIAAFGIPADVRRHHGQSFDVAAVFRRLEKWRDALSRDIRDGTRRHGPAADIPGPLRATIEGWLRPRPVPQDWAPTSLWNLSSVNCWKGGPATYFADRLASALPGVPIRELGVNASEGTFAFPVSESWRWGSLVGGHCWSSLIQPERPIGLGSLKSANSTECRVYLCGIVALRYARLGGGRRVCEQTP